MSYDKVNLIQKCLLALWDLRFLQFGGHSLKKTSRNTQLKHKIGTEVII